MRTFILILSRASGFYPLVFVSGAFRSSSGAHETGTEENILQRQRGNREAVRFLTLAAKCFMFCVPLWSRMFVCMCAHLATDRFSK